MDKRKQSKWQIASTQITSLKWEIEHVLANFSEEEKQTEKYAQLLQTLDLIIDHILHKYREDQIKELQEENAILQKKNSWFSWRTLVIAVTGGLLTEVAKFVIKLLAFIMNGDLS